MKKLYGWQTATISDLAAIAGGSGFPEIYQGNPTGDHPFIKVSDLNLPGNEKHVRTANNWISEDVRKKLKAKLQPTGAIVFAKVGGALLTNKRRILTRPTVIDNNMMSLAATAADPGFLYQVMLSIDLGRYRQEGAVPSINGTRVGEIALDTPPLPEQRKIADILSTWDESLETLDALIVAKDSQKQALMQQLLTGKTRVKGAKGKWISAKLGDLFDERVERDRIDLPLLSITADRGVVPRDELAKRDTSSEDKSKYLRIAPGDIGYNTMRMWQGVSALSTLEGIVSPAYTICRPTDRIDGKFAAHFFKFPHTIHLFHRWSQGLVDDTLNLKFPSFSVIEVVVPESIAEQQQIAAILDTADQELTLLRTQRQALDQQKRGLMQRLLTGKIRVKP